MFSARFVLLWALLWMAGPLAAAQETLFIGQIRVEDTREHPLNDSGLRYRILHADPAGLQTGLAEWVQEPEAIAGGIRFVLQDYPSASTVMDPEQHRNATFLIDYEEPEFRSLDEQIQQQYGPQPSARQLETFVHEYIADKNSAHGFDIASAVARSRAGDCTEHAVLLTAALRMYGYPARTVTGLYISLEEPVLAYGHAWVEYHAEGRWSGLDATQISKRVGPQHIPLGVVEDESMGYAMGLISTLHMLAIDRVIIE